MSHLIEAHDTGAAIAAVNEAHASGLFNAHEEQTMSNSINGIKIYAMNDCDWVVARSKEEARHHYGRIAVPEDFENVQELSGEQLDELDYFIERRGGPAISFRQRLQQIVDRRGRA
ncbi:hypothetical protein JOS77_28080 [Chromobacterium haemolyticum]|nr:hypothetical protein JOS77_28080 [Chromobacterium haemolyticum]